MEIQKFEADEYVAACWTVGCSNNTTAYQTTSNAPYGNHWSGSETYGTNPGAFVHSSDGCQNAALNEFIADGNSLTGISFLSENGTHTYSGGFDYIVDVDGSGTVSTGDVIYWYTVSSGNTDQRRWNHWGYVQIANASHPNRS